MEAKLVGNAHLVEGGEGVIPALLAFLKRGGTKIKGNADLYVREYARFGADDARELRERAQTRAVLGAGRVFIVATPTMTTEAQNVLLKTLEEPPAGASFFLVVPTPQTLLPTLRSRMQTLALASADEEGLVDAGVFLAARAEKRIEMLKPLLEKDDDDRRDLRPIFAFLASLEIRLAKHPSGAESVYRARKYMSDKGALIKPLLEQIALLVPVVK